MKNLKRTLGATLFSAIALLGFALPAQAVVTSYWSIGSTCTTGNNTGSYQTSGPNVLVSLCVTTTAEGVCGATIQPLAAVGESGRFNITARTLGAALPDPTNAAPAFPIPINNPNNTTDFGGTINVPGDVAPAAAANQLLATFTLSPQATATAASYTIFASVITAVATDAVGGDCFTAPVETNVAPASFTLNFVTGPVAPTITSAATTTFTVGTAGTFTVTATGSPAPTLSVTGALPAGVTFTPGTGVLAGTPTVGGTFPLTFTAANGVLPNATQSFSLVVNPSNQTITFAPASPQPFSASPFTVTATATSGLPVTVTSTTTGVCTVAGFVVTFVTAGSCNLTATQGGNASFNAAAPVSRTIVITASAPAAPTIGAATAGNTQATIAFTAPTNNGGSPITGFTVTCNPGAITGTGAASPITVTGLTNGTLYTCFVFATNALGNSPNSGNVTVTPVAISPPAAPTIGTAFPLSGGAAINFTAPTNNGGSPITSFTVTCNPGGITGTGTTSPITVVGLSNFTAYTCSVTATNVAGTGPASATVGVTPSSSAAIAGGIPTLSEWAMLLLSGLLVVIGARRIRAIPAAS